MQFYHLTPAVNRTNYILKQQADHGSSGSEPAAPEHSILLNTFNITFLVQNSGFENYRQF